MYSPFTSIIPFSAGQLFAFTRTSALSYLPPSSSSRLTVSDIIPFPSTDPPTPPSTLTPDQQGAAKRAVGILNDEIKGQNTAQHLNETLAQLQRLLHRDKLPE
jgi:cohesin loading factor subunit SCC2